MFKPTTSLLLLSIASLGLGACSSDPPTPAAVRAKITSDLGNVLRETAAATDGASSMIPSGSIAMIEKVLGQGGTAAASNLLGSASKADGEEDAFDPDAVIEQLNTTIFTAANEVEPGIYTVPSSLACTSSTFDENGIETSVLDEDCATNWDKLVLRIRVEDDNDGLTFAIQLGATHDEPLEIGLTHTSVSVSVDLDAAEAAAQAIASALGEQAPNADLSGKVTGTLSVIGTAKIAVAFTVDRAVQIAVAEQGDSLTGPDAFRLTSAASHVLALELDGNAGVGAVTLDLGATTVHVPGEDEAFDLDLPGASFAAHVASGGPLHVDNISLGDRTTTLSKNGVIGFAIDLNPTAGRKLDATITHDAATGTETIEVSPKLDARIMTNHSALGDEMGRYDVTGVLLDGTLRGSEDSDQIEVVSGTFSIATNPTQYGFNATAGQCVAGEDTFDPTTGDDYTLWTVAACQ